MIRSNLYVGIALSLACFVFMLIFFQNRDINLTPLTIFLTLLACVYYGFSIVIGWLTLHRFSSKLFDRIPVIGFLLYALIKFYASVFVGFFYSPFWLYKNVKIYRH
jgi:hypothetical protein